MNHDSGEGDADDGTEDSQESRNKDADTDYGTED